MSDLFCILLVWVFSCTYNCLPLDGNGVLIQSPKRRLLSVKGLSIIIHITHLYRITSVLHVTAAAAPSLSAAVRAASPCWAGVVLRLPSHRGGVAAQEVLLGGARARRLRGGQASRPALEVGAHLTGSKEHQLIGRPLHS